MTLESAMTKLRVWPIPDDDLPNDQSHLIVTFGPPISRELRCSMMQQLLSRMTSLEGWSYYNPDDCVVELSSDDEVYGALYSSGDMYVFDVTLYQVREIENEKAFGSENKVAFSSLIILDKRDWKRGYLDNKNGNNKKKKVQMLLVNRKPRVNTFMKMKWEREKVERKEVSKIHVEKYKERLMTDHEFAKREEDKRQMERERARRKRMEALNKKQRDEDLNVLFENFFGENRTWGPMAESYKTKFGSAYMPIGEGRLLFEHTILRKENLYERLAGGVTVPIKDPLIQRNLLFANGNVLPINIANFEVWYRRLPIHKIFLQGMESEIHYLAPDNKQPDFPFVYVGWKFDCEFSDGEDCDYDEETRISPNVTWDRDRCDSVDD